MKQKIAIKKLSGIVLPKQFLLSSGIKPTMNSLQIQLQMEAMNLGFCFSEDALNAIVFSNNKTEDIDEIFTILKELVGADKVWKPFYPNFPQQVIDISEMELYTNAIIHYWTHGLWRPEGSEPSKLPTFENVKFKEIKLLSGKEFSGIFTSVLGSNGSITDFDKEIINWFLDKYSHDDLEIPNIPFKETLCQFAAECFNRDSLDLFKESLKTTTDILRVACYFSGGDITLATKTKFKLTNKQRKFIVESLEEIISEEDVARYEKEWVKLFHHLHIGTYKKAFSCNEIALLARNGKCKSFNSFVESALLNKNINEAVVLLKQRSGDFARRLDHIIRVSDSPNTIVDTFLEVASKVDTRVLFQVLNHFKYRNDKKRIALPKGNIQKAFLLPQHSVQLDGGVIKKLTKGIKNILVNKFTALSLLGTVYIDPMLKKAPIPMSMRTASDGLKVLQRGTRLPLGDNNILRFFVHWIGQDIDLSACFLNEDLKFHSTISYYNLKSGYGSSDNGYNAVHSGDVTFAPAPDGGCEFIDIDLNSITDKTIRYVAMDVRVFSGCSFLDQQASAGWMMRTEIGSTQGKIFDPKTVEQRISLSTISKQCLVALFDIKEREVIWLDLNGQSNMMHGGNNIESNKANLETLVEAAVNLKQPTLYQLFKLHTKGRGVIVKTKEEADIIFDEQIIYN